MNGETHVASVCALSMSVFGRLVQIKTKCLYRTCSSPTYGQKMEGVMVAEEVLVFLNA